MRPVRLAIASLRVTKKEVVYYNDALDFHSLRVTDKKVIARIADLKKVNPNKTKNFSRF